MQSNIQNPNEDEGETKSKSTSEEAKNVVNYEISKKIIKEKDNAFAKVDKIQAAVTFDSTILDAAPNKEEFLAQLKAIVEDGIGSNPTRGDKVTVQAFKFIANDVNGTAEEGSLQTFAAKSLMQEYGEYIQYLISAILLFVFYKIYHFQTLYLLNVITHSLNYFFVILHLAILF